MEVSIGSAKSFKVWLGDFGLITRKDCPNFILSGASPEQTENLYSVIKVNEEQQTIALVDCCLTKEEADKLVNEAINQVVSLNSKIAKGFNS